MERFIDITGCAKRKVVYPCCDGELTYFETIEYPVFNQNYDLMRETHDWYPYQIVPSLLAPRLARYRH